MAESRTKNTRRNIVSGMIKQALSILLPFFVRTILLYTLGKEYQGLSGLFTSVLKVLNLADLGFSTAVVYALYKPVSEDDVESICAIVAFLKKIYRIVGCVVLLLGVGLLPFISYLISGDCPPAVNIYVLYSIYLLNTVISYFFFAYKSALLIAMQREDVVSNIGTITTVLLNVVQAVVLLLFKNYYLYAIFMPLATVVNNVLLQYASKKHFPHIVPKGIVCEQTKRELKFQVQGIFINRVGDVARNSLDNIILSVLFGLATVAIYDNYYYIYSAVYGISLVFVHAMQASVGNSVAKETIEKNYQDLKKFTFIFSWFSGWCTISMCCLYQPFVFLWMDGQKDMMLSNMNMLLFCLYFYAITMNNTRNLYINGCGLYWECRTWCFVEAIGNLILNIILGYYLGITGVIVATIITIFVCNFVARTNVLFKKYFKQSPISFYKAHIAYFVVTVINGIITYWLCGLITLDGVIGLICKMGVCIIIPNVVYLGMYFHTKQFKVSIGLVKKVLSKAV